MKKKLEVESNKKEVEARKKVVRLGLGGKEEEDGTKEEELKWKEEGRGRRKVTVEKGKEEKDEVMMGGGRKQPE